MMEVEGSPRSLKRDHDSFEELADLEEPCSVPANYLEMIESQRDEEEPAPESLPTPPVSVGTKRDPSPARSTTGSLTDAGTVTPPLRGQSPMLGVPPPPSSLASPSAFTALNGTASPPPKKAKLTFAEKEARRIEKEFKDQQKAEEKARKEAERQAHAEEKARKEAEKEADRKKKEAEREERRVAQEAEKAAKEEKRRKREEEKQRAEEERRKKERSQMKLGNFFNIPATTRPRGGSVDSRGRSSLSPAPPNSNPSLVAAASPAASTPSKPQLTPYEKLFPAFFIQNGVTLAPFSRFERDQDALGSIQNVIDGYILGNRSPGRQRSFNPIAFFHLSSHEIMPRGKRCMPVKEIMTGFYSGNVSKPIDLTTDSQNSQIKRTGDLLRKIPMKFLQFQEDVRPPYRGTYTSRPVNGMTKLARNPLRKDLPNTDYDYDSEAEWIEDEDAEDLKSEGDEDEEVDDDEDMDGFLDDENDETANSRRLVLQGDLEPVSTGLCWEDRKKRNSNVKMMPYRMEVILGMLVLVLYTWCRSSADPFRPEHQIHQPLFQVILGACSSSYGPSPHSAQYYEDHLCQRQRIYFDRQNREALLHNGHRRPKGLAIYPSSNDTPAIASPSTILQICKRLKT
jgi:chromatin assembly factor 1 subunit A